MRTQVRHDLWILAALSLLTLVAMGRVVCCGFVSYDDPLYIVDNEYVRQGLSPESWTWAWSADDRTGNWHPLTWLSLMLDVEMFGVRPLGHHAVNLLIHVLAVCGLYLALSQLTRWQLPSGWAAAAFAVHPVHVESVAWISERKDVLSGLFWMLGLIAYARYTRAASSRGAILWYLSVTVMYGLGLLSKPMMVTFPCVLLLFDAWPLGRIRIASAATADATDNTISITPLPRSGILWCVVEKLPWFVLAALMCVATIKSQGASVISLDEVSRLDRLLHTPNAYVTYLSKTAWPTRLSVFYPRDGFRDSAVCGTLSLGLLLLISVWCWNSRRLFPARLIGWLWFLGTLIPVIGIVQVGHQAIADRYLYLPQIGLLMILAFGFQRIENSIPIAMSDQRRHAALTRWIPVAGLVLIPIYVVLSYVQIGQWRNSTRLYEHAIAVTRNNWQCHFNLGVVFSDAGQHREAIEQYQTVLRLRPSHPKVHNNLGVCLAALGKYDEAIRIYRAGLSVHPQHGGMRMNLGNVLARTGKFEAALMEYVRARQIAPDNLQVLYNLAQCQASAGHMSDAIQTAHYALERLSGTGMPQFRRQIQDQLTEWEHSEE